MRKMNGWLDHISPQPVDGVRANCFLRRSLPLRYHNDRALLALTLPFSGQLVCRLARVNTRDLARIRAKLLDGAHPGAMTQDAPKQAQHRVDDAQRQQVPPFEHWLTRSLWPVLDSLQEITSSSSSRGPGKAERGVTTKSCMAQASSQLRHKLCCGRGQGQSVLACHHRSIAAWHWFVLLALG